MEPPLFHLYEHDGPLILNFPHSGTYIPDEIEKKLNERGRAVPDTDWHVPELYEFAKGQVSWMEATHSRYVVDLNRDPEGAELYPGQAGTGLCPTTDFDGYDIYLPDQQPTESEIGFRSVDYHLPVYAKLSRHLNDFSGRTKILLDCHSIRSEVPRLFEGKLPDLNLGSFGGKSCDRLLARAAENALTGKGFSFVHNGRFKGGWNTRYFGQPKSDIHVLQLEIAQSAYLNENNPQEFDIERAKPLQKVLQTLVTALQEWGEKEGFEHYEQPPG